MNNNLEEINNLEDQINLDQRKLNKKTDSDSIISKIKTQRNIFIIFTILFLAALLYALFLRKNKISNNYLNDNNLSIINKDSLRIYKEGYTNNLIINNTDKLSLKDEKIIYSVQIGAFKDFKFTSKDIHYLSESQLDGLNKISMGNYKTYAEAKILKDSLLNLGFKDCFLAAKSFGNPIDIREALVLSNEPEFLEQ